MSDTLKCNTLKMDFKNEKTQKCYDCIMAHIERVKIIYERYYGIFKDYFRLMDIEMKEDIEPLIKDHAESLFSPEEFYALRDYYFTDDGKCMEPLWCDYTKKGDRNVNAQTLAVLHHIHNNPYCPEYWCSTYIDDAVTYSSNIFDMPNQYIIEYICYLTAICWEYNNNEIPVWEWYVNNANKILVTPCTRGKIEDLLDRIQKFEECT